MKDKCTVCGTTLKLLLTSWYCPRDCDKPKAPVNPKEYDSEPTGIMPAAGGWTVVHAPGSPKPYTIIVAAPVNVAQYTCHCCATKTWYYIDAVAGGQTCPQDGKLYLVPGSAQYMQHP